MKSKFSRPLTKSFDCLFKYISIQIDTLNPAAASNQDYVDVSLESLVAVLGFKANKFSQTAVKLLLSKDYQLSEAIVLTRCAYEAVVWQSYIRTFPEKKNSYLCWQDLRRYQKFQEWLSYLSTDDGVSSIKKAIEDDKKFITKQLAITTDIDSGLKAKFLNNNPGDKFEGISLIKALEEIRDVLEESNNNDELPLSKLSLLDDAFRYNTYRLGSNHVHPDLNTILDYIDARKPKEISISNCLSMLRIISELNLLNLLDSISCDSSVCESIENIILVIDQLHSEISEQYGRN